MQNTLQLPLYFFFSSFLSVFFRWNDESFLKMFKYEEKSYVRNAYSIPKFEI